jgi:hypothetical protein
MSVVEEEAPPEEESSEPKEKYVVVRQTEFHGLGCEEWLNLIVKVSISPGPVAATADRAVLLCLDGEE